MLPLRGALVLCLAVLAAGCAGLAVQEAEPTVTPVEVPSATPTAPVEASLGASVAETHRAVLSSTNYTLRTEWRVVGRDGDTRVRVHHVRRVGAGGTTYAGQYRSSTRAHPVYANNSQHVAYWTNETAEALHYVETESDPRLYARTDDGPVSDPAAASRVQSLLAGANATVAERTASGDVVVRASDVDREFTLRRSPYVADISGLELRVVVAPSGVVERWQASYDARLSSPFSDADSVPVTVVRTGTVADVGNTTVDRPGWLSNATRPANGTAE